MSDHDDNHTDADEQHFVPLLVHELRTPLTALLGSLGLLTGAVEDATPEVRSFAAIAGRNADRLALILDDVAEYWRLNDPAASLNREPTNVADTVQRAIEQVQTLVDERGIVLDVDTTPADATIDAPMVRMAVARLLTYALGVSPKKSTVRVRVTKVDGGSITSGAEKCDALGSFVVVSVSDGGKTVAVESIARMFEPFSAVARAGAGPAIRKELGLVIAMRVALLHAGSLTFASTDQGGLFEFRLPA